MTRRERVVLENAARSIMADFRLTREERAEECERLAAMLVQVTSDHLENLEHVRLPARPGEGVR